MSENHFSVPTVVARFDERVYSMLAIKKAAYRMGDRCSFAISIADGEVTAVLTPRGVNDNLALLEAEFRNAVLDQDLREIVARETEAVRNLIIAQAFSRTALLEPIGETADFRQDPLGIRVPDRK